MTDGDKAYCFEGYTLDLRRGSLRTVDQEIELRPKSFDVLRYLVENAGRLVPKDELINAVWPSVVVTDDSLTRCVSDVRLALADREHRIIRTVQRRGYLFVPAASESTMIAASTEPTPLRAPANEKPALVLPDKPSIAVLPFQNLSSDAEQEYFADGVVEEITTALSRIGWLFVIARNSSFTYKGRVVDVKQVGRELGVRYVLEGSVRKAGDRVRIAGQLIDASTGTHLWADRFDGGLDDIFDLQDQVAASVVAAIAPKLQKAEIERAKRKPTESLDAYDYYLRGLASSYQSTSRQANAEALRLFKRAIELDPDFASAYAYAGACYAWRKINGWLTDTANEIAEAEGLARRGAVVGKDDPAVLAEGAWVLATVGRDLEAAATMMDRALVLDPNRARTIGQGGMIKIWLGEPDAGIECLARAMRLSPLDPGMQGWQFGMALAYFFLGRNDEASSWAATGLQAAPDAHYLLRIDAAANALAGQVEQAQKSVARLRELSPTLRFSNLREFVVPYRRADDLARFEEGLRKAGLPE